MDIKTTSEKIAEMVTVNILFFMLKSGMERPTPKYVIEIKDVIQKDIEKGNALKESSKTYKKITC